MVSSFSNDGSMDIRGYETKTNERYLDYEFYSEGPKGKIKKIVRFTLRSANGTTYFNLGFGDSNNIDNEFDDLIKSNNHDKDKVLATIAHIVIQFSALKAALLQEPDYIKWE